MIYITCRRHWYKITVRCFVDLYYFKNCSFNLQCILETNFFCPRIRIMFCAMHNCVKTRWY